jgi:hypothetical protein
MGHQPYAANEAAYARLLALRRDLFAQALGSPMGSDLALLAAEALDLAAGVSQGLGGDLRGLAADLRALAPRLAGPVARAPQPADQRLPALDWHELAEVVAAEAPMLDLLIDGGGTVLAGNLRTMARRAPGRADEMPHVLRLTLTRDQPGTDPHRAGRALAEVLAARFPADGSIAGRALAILSHLGYAP